MEIWESYIFSGKYLRLHFAKSENFFFFHMYRGLSLRSYYRAGKIAQQVELSGAQPDHPDQILGW